MRKILAAAALALALTLPAGCADDIYGRGSLTWSSHPYYGWYDGYYGDFYDGYWGTDGFFWFRLAPHENRYRVDRERHFRSREVTGQPHYKRFERNLQPPPRGTRMPNFPNRRDRRD
ncbi:hypothetical protein [Altererythrobacter sp. Z27]|uniref:hypothetical protein n=1 Tax=Altererythrobacter sp. Z27 TaxID=3461147 RepID=UPI00404478B3